MLTFSPRMGINMCSKLRRYALLLQFTICSILCLTKCRKYFIILFLIKFQMGSCSSECEIGSSYLNLCNMWATWRRNSITLFPCEVRVVWRLTKAYSMFKVQPVVHCNATFCYVLLYNWYYCMKSPNCVEIILTRPIQLAPIIGRFVINTRYTSQ